MDEYSLQVNEAVLYKGSASFESGNISNASDILLTSINLVAVIKTRKLFQKEQVEVKTYPVSEIKVYDGIPQLKQKGSTVEIYFANAEVKLNFDSKFTVLKFVNVANKLVTGKSMSERGTIKVKGAVNLVDEALGLKTVDAIKGVLENGIVGTVFGGIGKKNKVLFKASGSVNTIVDAVGAAKSLIGDKATVDPVEKPEDSQEKILIEQIEALKKLKELVNDGILTQEEFDTKKRQIMGL